MPHPHPLRQALHRCALSLAGAMLLATSAWAGEVFERDGLAISGYDVVAYFTGGAPLKGDARFKAEFKGATFLFASQAHRDAFAADPAKYAPQYGGFCAFGLAGGYKAAIDPTAFSVVDGKLYLNYNRAVQTRWTADVPGFIAKADKHWPSVMAQTKVHN